MAKEGSTIGGLMDCFGTAVSMSLQYGVPLEVYVNKFSHTRFEPWGYTKNPDIRIAKSLVDYIFRWLGITFLPGYREANTPKREPEAGAEAKSDPKNGPPPRAAGAATKNGPTNPKRRRVPSRARSNRSPPRTPTATAQTATPAVEMGVETATANITNSPRVWTNPP